MTIKELNISRKKMSLYASLVVFSLFFFLSPQDAHAARILLSPSSGSYGANEAFSIDVYLSSPDQSSNAVSGIISFPPAITQVASISKSGSIVNMWAQEPAFSNSEGTVSFEGVVFNPGFTGSSGKIFSIVFRGRQAGEAVLTFISGSVLANDGNGTEIGSNFGRAVISLRSAVVPPQVQIVEPQRQNTSVNSALSAPIIFSSTHPDQNKWYKGEVAKFSWDTPNDVSAVRLLVGKISDAVPTVTYDPPINTKELSGLEDGVWYFHVRMKNSSGWGETAHFRFRVDNTPPIIPRIIFAEGKETDNPRPTVFFETTDMLSGIDHYKIKVGDESVMEFKEREVLSNPVVLRPQAPGKKLFLVQAFDKAGNFSTMSEEIVIKPIQSPKVIQYSNVINPGDIFEIYGKSLPRSTVKLFIKNERGDEKESQVISDANGNFIIAIEDMDTGSYTFSLQASDDRGAMSERTESFSFLVETSAFFRGILQARDMLAAVVSVAALIFLLIFIFLYGKRQTKILKRKIMKDTRDAEKTIHEMFIVLKNEVEKKIRMIEIAKTKRKLTEEEEKIVKELTESLEGAESLVSRKMKNIEKDVD